MNNVQIEAI